MPHEAALLSLFLSFSLIPRSSAFPFSRHTGNNGFRPDCAWQPDCDAQAFTPPWLTRTATAWEDITLSSVEAITTTTYPEALTTSFEPETTTYSLPITTSSSETIVTTSSVALTSSSFTTTYSEPITTSPSVPLTSSSFEATTTTTYSEPVTTSPTVPLTTLSFETLTTASVEASTTISSGGASATGLPLSIDSQGDGVNVYLTGIDANGLLVLLQPDGQWYYPSSGISSSVPTVIPADQITIPVPGSGQSTNLTMPTNVSGGRIWLAQGSLQFSVVLAATGPALVEPSISGPAENATTWGFVEFTYTADGIIYADTTYVDFVSMNLKITLTGTDIGTQTTPGLQPNAIQSLCADLASQASTDGYPWNELCVADANGRPYHVLAPADYIDRTPDAFADYWTSYVDQVWSTYSGQPLIINSQSGQVGNISCTVGGDLLTCTADSGSSGTFAKPSATDIFSCSTGPFVLDSSATDVQAAVVPRLCAAFNRSTLLLDGGNVQPDGVSSSSYYGAQTTNWYSKLVHQLEVNGRGYAFPYDDVTPDNEMSENMSGTIVSTDPKSLIITISS
ncbi:uncharacterized protein PV06_09607 [Exophiala oligosperma]|uniref:GH64 domain-containing protein n=1 Tax=Exophiala oligosperma TaxID=215243 RepID=A0A0D2AER3_9EURO|nr:uncharacterized protein PV06_09607 [Exophiala oligosperma]KIW38656.1 hypothetical protein PV06_09607 [Exophiala oligosperma]